MPDLSVSGNGYGHTMKPVKRYDHETLRLSNRAIIFSALKKEGEISRFELSKKTGVSPATVGTIIDDFIREGLVRELRLGASTGGRRPVLVDLEPDGLFNLVGMLTVRGLELALVNLGGQIVDHMMTEKVVTGNEAVRSFLQEAVTGFLKKTRVHLSGIKGAAVSVPGMIRASDGFVLYSPPLRLYSFDLPGILHDLTGKTTAVYKDMDALLLAESQKGIARGERNVVYIWVKEGVGMSYLHEGEALILPHGGFELGHTAWIRGEALTVCHCGTPGCVGTELSESHAVALYRGISGNRDERCDYAVLGSKAKSGDQDARKVLRIQAETLGAVIANVVNFFNPAMIVVGGPFSEAPEDILDGMRSVTIARSLPPFKSSVRIEYSSMPHTEVFSVMSEDILKKLLFPVL